MNLFKLLTVLGFLSAAPAYSAVLFFTPSTTTISIGQTIDLQASIDTVTDLAGYQFDLLFDNTLFASTAITDGTIFTTGGNTDFFIPGTVLGGTISGNANALFGASGVSATNGLLATFSFQALANGVGTFSFDLINLLDSNGAQIPPDPSLTAQITVADATVPEPASMALVGAAAAAGVLLRRRMRRANA